MEIRLATPKDQHQVVNVLNEVTLALQKKDIYQWDYPWEVNKIANEINNYYTYVLLLEEKIIGTFCIKDIDCISELTIDPKSYYLSQIAILPKYQGNNYGSKITDFACYFAKERNKIMYLDCWSGNEKLKKFYLNNGFKYQGDFPEEDYFISIFKVQ